MAGKQKMSLAQPLWTFFLSEHFVHTAVTSPDPWLVSPQPYSLGALRCFFCFVLFFLQRILSCSSFKAQRDVDTWCSWAGSQTCTFKRPVTWHSNFLSAWLSASSFLFLNLLLCSPLSGTRKIFSIIFFLPCKLQFRVVLIFKSSLQETEI